MDKIAATPIVSVVVPVYNGAVTIAALVAALQQLSVPGGLEIVLVVDGSPDNSLAICQDLARQAVAPIVVIAHSRNFGEHNAVMTGLRYASGRYVITMDDDLQNPPGEVLRLLDHMVSGGYDVVYSYYAEKNHAGWRNLGSRLHNAMADRLLDKPHGLYLSSFRCLSQFVVEQIIRYTGPYPYIDGLILQITRSIGRLEVAHLPRAAGKSNYTLRRLIRLWSAMALNFSVLPLRIAALLGLFTASLGMIAVVWILCEALGGETPLGWASTLSILLLVAGVQLVMLGIVGEYLGRLFLTVNNKPQAIVRSVYSSPALADIAGDGVAGTMAAGVDKTGDAAAWDPAPPPATVR